MVIFAALFIVVATILFGAFRQRIKDFLREDVLGTLLRQLSGNQGIDGGTRGDTEAGEELEPLTPLSSSSTTRGFEFEVFLSFRGEDTRKGFTGHLYEGLELRGVSTFMDSDKLERGEDINKLFEYIERSKICIPIFSKRYADSTWCLKEVTKSVECGKEIVPVFFGVEPSDVRYQNGPFKYAFEKHESNKKLNQEEVRKWRRALKKVGNLFGFNLKNMNWDEAELKRAIIKRVLNKVNKKPLEVAKHPVGIETRIGYVRKMLENVDTNGVLVLGIHGMGGLGKTTIAKAVYNDLMEGFNGASCFLSNIREKSAQPSGLVALQEQLISDVLMVQDIPLSDVAQGKVLIKERANRKGVLLILDDVDSIEQLDALAGGRDWFGSGSVIIITTRDEKALLSCNMKVKQHEIYKPQELNEDESLELFMHHAFNDVQPHGEYLRLSNEVVEAAGGLPLTLEVLGSLLTCDMDVQQWKNVLEKLKRIPPGKVQQRLKLSYDSLDDMEKKIFLDISCFFIGYGREKATYMWESCGWFPNYAIKVLVERSLIVIDEEDKELLMHDQIRDMGRAIVEEESSCKPEKQSRLWNSQDSWSLLQRKVPVTIDAEGMDLMPDETKPKDKCVSAQCFEEMPNMRYFCAWCVNFQGTFQRFPADLKWLYLWKCHFDSPPSDFNLEEIAVFSLYHTNMAQILINQLSPRGKAFEKLKVLSIDGAEIKVTPDFMCLPCLVELTLKDCPVLTTIDESIGKLERLACLSITACPTLEKLPDSICRLSSLKELRITSCSKISSLPERLGDLESLMKLEIEKASIKTIPDSVGGLTKLCELIVVDCVHLNVLPDSICWLSSLKVLSLDLGGLGSLPERLGDMGSLSEFDLCGTHIDKIPDSIGELKNLRKLLLSRCARLSRLPDSICLLSSLEILDLEDCLSLASLPERLGDMGALRKLKLSSTSIDKIPDSISHLTNLRELLLLKCRLSDLPDSICRLNSLEMLDLKRCRVLFSVSERIGDMEALKKLDLSWTLIHTIPDSIGLLTNLRELSLEGSQLLRELPDSICQLSLLKSLSLEGCYGLYTLPERLGDMEKLEELILDNTRIEIIPDSVGQLKNLRLLSLQGCKLLKALPNSIRELCSLRELKISGTNLRGFENDICHLVAINELTSSSSELFGLCDQSHKAIRHLHLIDAAIEELPDCVGRMENLEELLLECEMLRALPNWIERFSKKLTELEIRSKLLKTLPDCIGSLKQLTKVTLECDNLRALPDSIGSLEKILWLDLDCENLEALPDSVGRLSNIRTLEILSDNLKALPNSIMSLEWVERLHLYCLSLEAIPDFIGGWKHLHDFYVLSSSLKALPDSIGSLKGVRVLKLKCKNLEMLPDSIGELELLSYFEVFSHGLKYLPNSIRSLTRIEFLILECVNLEALSNSMETLQSLVHLGLHCDNFTAPPDFIGRLENLMVFSFKSKNLKHLHATTCVSLGRLKQLSLSGCENLEDLADASTQQSGFAHLTSLQSLYLVDCKRLEYLPQLPSSLFLLDASRCISLRKTSEVSNLTTLTILNLGCCKLLEDVPGLENIATNLKVLELPGPCGFTESCHLRHDFKNKVSKEITFENLKSFKMSGSLVEGSATGQQQLHFILPKFPFSWLRRARLYLHLDKVLSPIHIAIIANDIIVFEKIAEVEGDGLNLDLSEESIVSTGQGEHCYTIQVTVDVSQLQNVWALIERSS